MAVLTDPISDFLTRFKNAARAGNEEFHAPYSKIKADTDRALIDSGRRLVVVADHTKWGVIGISSIAGLDQTDILITDRGLDEESRRMLEGLVRQLIVVDPAAVQVPNGHAG